MNSKMREEKQEKKILKKKRGGDLLPSSSSLHAGLLVGNALYLTLPLFNAIITTEYNFHCIKLFNKRIREKRAPFFNFI